MKMTKKEKTIFDKYFKIYEDSNSYELVVYSLMNIMIRYSKIK